MTILDSSEPSCAAPESQMSWQSLTGSERLKLYVQICDGCAVVGMWGELFADTIGELTRLADGLMSDGRYNIVLDLSRLYDLDEDAIAEFDRLQTALAAHKGSFSLAAPRPWVRRLLESMCRKDTFPVHATVADAIAQTATRPTAA